MADRNGLFGLLGHFRLPVMLAALVIVSACSLAPTYEVPPVPVAAQYRAKLSDLPGIALQRDVDDSSDRHSWCMFAVTIDETRARVDRDTFIEELRAHPAGTVTRARGGLVRSASRNHHAGQRRRRAPIGFSVRVHRQRAHHRHLARPR